MKRIKGVYTTVLNILTDKPSTRNSDRELICEYYKAIGVNVYRPFEEVMQNVALPPFESIRRSRQRAQAAFPALRADDEITAYREMNEETVKNWAVGKGN